jgi:tetratricopeptide (TPR) repeat protein
MSKTTRSSEKARPETLSRHIASAKEKKTEKTLAAASMKQPAGRSSKTPPNQAINNSGKKETSRQKPAAAGKPAPGVNAPAVKSATPAVSHDDASAQLLRRSKTTASALAQLEKGIEFIHRKDFKKAIAELQSLIEKYKNETEITASARSYIDICRRSEARQKKTPPETQNQAYALGILEHNKANYDKAISYFRQSLEKHPQADYVYYSIAASLALKGDDFAAIENLRRAVELNKDSFVHAKNDQDFASLEKNKEFLDLIGVPAPRKR